MRPAAILLPLALLAGCPQPEPEPEPLDVAPLVAAAVDAGCTAGSLEPLAEADPAAVRATLAELDASLKVTDPQVGMTQDLPIPATYRVPAIAAFEADLDWDLWVPEGYPDDPDRSWPVWVDPAHPTTDLQDPWSLPWLSELLGDGYLIVTVHFMNRLFVELDDDAYSAAFDDEVAAYHDYFGAIDAVLAELRRGYRVDSSHVYVGGVSAVGASSWFHGIAMADQYAALNPYSIIPAPFDDDLYRNLVNTGVLQVHGTADTITPIESVYPTFEMLEEWGFDAELWVMEGEGHGTMFSATLPEAAEWLQQRSRDLQPELVHKAVQDDRATEAFWLRATGFETELSGAAGLYPDPPAAVVEGTWTAGQLELEAEGVTGVEARWLEDDPGPASGRAGDEVTVWYDGAELGSWTLEEDPTVALEDYCRRADVSRSWAGRLQIDL